MLRRALLALATLSLVACGSGYESTVTYTITLKNGDISGTTVAEDDHVDDDDAQWRAFLNSAKAELGENPKAFDINKVRLQLDVTRAKNVGKLEDVFSDKGAVFLRAENGVQVDIATFKNLKGTAQVEVDRTGDLEDLQVSLAKSDFHIGLRSTTPMAANTDFEAPIRVTLDVVAR